MMWLFKVCLPLFFLIMSRRNDYASQIYLSQETHELLLKAVEFQKELEKDLGKNPRENRWRLANMKFDRDMIINKALREYLPPEMKKDVVGEDRL